MLTSLGLDLDLGVGLDLSGFGGADVTKIKATAHLSIFAEHSVLVVTH